MLWLGDFELPVARAAETITLQMDDSNTPQQSKPTIHGDPSATAWATQANVKDTLSFSWRIVGDTHTELPTVLARALQELFPKAVSAVVKERPKREKCSPPDEPLAVFTSVARTSSSLPGGLVRDSSYTVTACMGNCNAKPSTSGTWTVSRPPPGTDVLYAVAVQG